MAIVTYSVVTGHGVEYKEFDAPQEFADWVIELLDNYHQLVEETVPRG